MISKVVADLLAERRLERVPIDLKHVGRILRSCAQHLETAGQRAGADPSGSYSLLYDATRKAVTAHLLSRGLRATNTAGAHRTIVEYAMAELRGVVADQTLDTLDRLRRTRHRTEYEERPLSETEVRTDLAHAQAVVASIQAAIFPPNKNPRS